MAIISIKNIWFNCTLNDGKIHLTDVDVTGYSFNSNISEDDFTGIDHIDKSAFNGKSNVYSVSFKNDFVDKIDKNTFEKCRDLEQIYFDDLDYSESDHISLLRNFVGPGETKVKIYFREGYLCYERDDVESRDYVYHRFSESSEFFIKQKIARGKFKVIGTRHDVYRDPKTSVDNDCYVLGSKSLANTCIIAELSTNNISSIESKVFFDNTSISNLVMNTNVKQISADAFTGSYINKINIPSSFITADGYGLNRSYALNDLIYDEGIEYIAPSAMIDSFATLHNVYFPKTLTSIGDYAFAEIIDQFPRMRNINFVNASGLTTIGDYAFYNSIYSLENNVLRFPKSLLSVGNCSFGYRRDTYTQKLSTLDLSSPGADADMRNLKYIGLSAFIYNKLRNIYFNKNIQTIDEYAFAYPYRQYQTTIPDSIEHIYRNAFKNNIILNPDYTPDNIFKIDKKIEDLKYNSAHSNSPVIEVSIDDKYEAENYLGMTDYSCISALKSDYLSGFIFIHHDRMCFCPKDTYIDIINKIYARCSKDATEIYVPIYLKAISGQAFIGATNLTSVSADEFLSVGPSAFYDCSSLIYINDRDAFYHVNNVNDYQFYNCQKLENIHLTMNTQYIGDHAFYNCQKMSSMYDEDALSDIQYFQLSTIRDSAFENCSSLSVFDVCRNIKTFGDNVFDNCSKLDNINIYLADYEFRDLIDPSKTIKDIIIDKFYHVRSDFKCRINFNNAVYTNDGFPKIDNEFIKTRKYSETSVEKTALCALKYNDFYLAPQDYLNLSAIDKVDSFVFTDCEKLRSISFLPLSSSTVYRELDVIDDYAFYNCTNMANFNNGKAYCSKIGKYAFGNCQILIEMTLFYDRINEVDQGCFYGTSLNTLTIENCEDDSSKSVKKIKEVFKYSAENENPLELPEYCIIIFKNESGEIIEKCDYLFNSLMYSDVDTSKNQVIYIDKKKDSIKPMLIVHQDDSRRLPAILANTYSVSIIGRWK